jgi:hypothetical protein
MLVDFECVWPPPRALESRMDVGKERKNGFGSTKPFTAAAPPKHVKMDDDKTEKVYYMRKFVRLGVGTDVTTVTRAGRGAADRLDKYC